MTLQRIPRLTAPVKLVLRHLLQAEGDVWTTEVMNATTLDRNTVDLVLNRLQDANWVESTKEGRESAIERGTGPRRFWRLTDEGREAAIDVLAYGRNSTLNRAAESEAAMDMDMDM